VFAQVHSRQVVVLHVPPFFRLWHLLQVLPKALLFLLTFPILSGGTVAGLVAGGGGRGAGG
jgi:hypothetical protein